MDLATTDPIERIARVLAAQRLSVNADGEHLHAADAVDRSWGDYRDDAVAVLKTLRDPNAAMERAGDAAVWQRMIAAALGEEAAKPEPASFEASPSGADPLPEGP
jgi:hypothetical protein